MSVVISWLKDNYLDLAVKAFLSILSIILILLRSRASKRLKNEEQKSSFLQWLPTAVKFANDLFPIHGDGAKRLNYVVEKCSTLFPLISLSTIVESVDQILEADKKKEVIACEKVESSQKEGSQDIQSYEQNDESGQYTPSSVSRRNSSLASTKVLANSVKNYYFSRLADTQVNEPKKD